MVTSNPNEQLPAHLRRFSPSPHRDPDAGLRALGHYERKLPKWRYQLRQWLIPVVRWETPYLARVQKACRTPVLDSYFAFTANLGTHTFFMTFLPICFWCGFPDFGLALVQMLAMGVYLSGFFKDLVCLPRPLSPPLQRITMSGSAALEYGFPSTHTTNAVSVALFSLYQLHIAKDTWSPWTYSALCLSCYCYATSITLGRMYCGMHGFFDIIFGALLGASIAWLRVAFGQTVDVWNLTGSWHRPVTAIAVIGLAVKIHPEPADNCPCFDDSVAFLGVLMGAVAGTWHRAPVTGQRSSLDFPLAPMYPFSNNDLVKSGARLVCGVLVIFLWRAVMKPTLLKSLPPVFRFVDHWGFRLPRRYFLQARDYKSVPPLRKDDNVLPSAYEIPSMLASIRNPQRRRVSVGPQSEADAREFIANREQRRKDSRSAASQKRRHSRKRMPHSATSPASVDTVAEPSSEEEHTRQAKHEQTPQGLRNAATSATLRVDTRNVNLLTPPTSDTGASSDSGREDEKNDRAIFSALQKPRTHYDVEVITKLAVYAGIAWLAVEGNPLLFEYVGLV